MPKILVQRGEKNDTVLQRRSFKNQTPLVKRGFKNNCHCGCKNSPVILPTPILEAPNSPR